MDNLGIASLPNFDVTLRQLVEQEKFPLRDIGDMFGVSYERIRQLQTRFNIASANPRGKSVARIWDDSANCFVTVDSKVLTQARQAKRRAVQIQQRLFKKELKRRQLEVRRNGVVNAVRELAKELRREPTWREMACAVGIDTQVIPPDQHAVYVLNKFGWVGSKSPKGGARSIETLQLFRQQTGTRSRGYHMHGRIKWFETPRKCD